jgi:hypothetical protein
MKTILTFIATLCVASAMAITLRVGSLTVRPGDIVGPVLSGVAFPGETITSDQAGQFYLDGLAVGDPSVTTFRVRTNDIGKALTIVSADITSSPLKVWHPTNSTGTALVFLSGLSVTNAAGTPIAVWQNLADGSWVTQTNAASRATNIAAAYAGQPTTRFGSGDFYPFTGSLLSAFNGKGYAYIVAAFRDADRTGGASQHSIVDWSTDASSAATRLGMRTRASSRNYMQVGARASSGDAYTFAAAASFTNVMVLSAKLELGAGFVEMRSAGSPIFNATTTPTTFSASSSLSGGLGGVVVGSGGDFVGDISGVIVIARSTPLTDVELFQHERYLSLLVGRETAPQTQWFAWGTNSYNWAAAPMANVLKTNILLYPVGGTPTEGDISTHGYHHVAMHISDPRSSRLHMTVTSGGPPEDAGGQTQAYLYTDDAGTNWSSPVLIFPHPDVLYPTNLVQFRPIGAHASWPAGWYWDSNQLFVTEWITTLEGGYEEDSTSSAIFAREVFTNGTFGTIYRITTNSFTPKSGRLNPTYSADLNARLLPRIRVFSPWGGTHPGATNLAQWVNFGAFVQHDGLPGYELKTWSRDGSTNNLIQLVRYDQDQRQHARVSTNAGQSWSRTFPTGLPSGSSVDLNGISWMWGDRRWDGGHLVIGNWGMTRSNLYLAMLSSDLRVTNVMNIQTGIPAGSRIADGAGGKGGGVAYPWATLGSNNILTVTYSFQKTDIGSSTIQLP